MADALAPDRAVDPAAGTPDYDFHPVCTAFPLMDADAYAARLADYKDHPERADETVVVLAVDDANGAFKIADGRHHYLICNELGYPVRFEEWAGTAEELVEFVVGRNVNRRHCTPTQIAASLARLHEYARGGDRTKVSRDTLPPTQGQQASAAGIAVETLKRATKVRKKAPALLDPMRDGKIDATTAARAADLTAADVAEIAASDDPKATATRKLAGVDRPEDRAAGDSDDAIEGDAAGLVAPPGQPQTIGDRDAKKLSKTILHRTYKVRVAIGRARGAIERFERTSPFAPLVDVRGALELLNLAKVRLRALKPVKPCPDCDPDHALSDCRTCRGARVVLAEEGVRRG